ncbi:hypothetical protein [Mesorhizobium sp. B2-7-1]|uniref:hypothetical protein n=1 Tax=Mesorhizobium sp. B2-7-1 TaxID=2589909 RepID=UPI001FEEA3FD|nr:hypothetical protein [Mesorhizobium sp. B2-7-1]
MRLEISKPEDAAAAFADAWNRHDMDDFAVLFSEDANFVNVVGMWWKKPRRDRSGAPRDSWGHVSRQPVGGYRLVSRRIISGPRIAAL